MKIRFYGMDPLSLVDLDGMLTCTLFTSACNFRCPFCHNKDLVYQTNLKEIPFDEIINYLQERKNVLDAVCITGGEPTLYADLAEVLKPIKDLGYYIKLDTNGTNSQVIKTLHEQGLIDYVAMDLKNSWEKYYLTIGNIICDLKEIQKSIDYLHNSNLAYEFRTTIVEEYHTLDDLIKIATSLKPDDKYFLQKFVDQGHCIQEGLHEIKEIEAQKYIEEIKRIVHKASLRGY